jgi:hypothetical protein
MSIDFDEITVENKKFSLTLDWIGEGIFGDYDNEDANDAPLLRYWVSQKIDGVWDDVHNGSACCLLKASDKRKDLKKAAKIMLDLVTNAGEDKLNSIVQMISHVEIIDDRIKLPRLI